MLPRGEERARGFLISKIAYPDQGKRGHMLSPSHFVPHEGELEGRGAFFQGGGGWSSCSRGRVGSGS